MAGYYMPRNQSSLDDLAKYNAQLNRQNARKPMGFLGGPVPTQSAAPAPTGLQRMMPQQAPTAGPSAMQRLLGDQYSYPSAMGRVGMPQGQMTGDMTAGQSLGLGRLMRPSAPQAPGNFDTVQNPQFNTPYYQARRGMGGKAPVGPAFSGIDPGAALTRAATLMGMPEAELAARLQQQRGQAVATRPAPGLPVTSQNPFGIPNSQQYAQANGYQPGPAAPAQAANRPSPFGFGNPDIQFSGRQPQPADAAPAVVRQFNVPQQQDFPGNATTQAQADGRRQLGYNMLENRGAGYWDEKRQAFLGRNAKGFPGEDVSGRLAAGGTTPSALSSDQLASNRVAMLGRLAANREKAMGRVQELAAASTAERRRRLNPSPMDRLMQNNPAAALAMQNQQNVFGQQQALQRLENEGRVGAAREQGLAEAQGWQNRIMGGLAMGGNQQALAKLGLAPPAGPQFQPGQFNGVDQGGNDAIAEYAKNHGPEEVEAFIRENAPAEAQNDLIQKFAPPNFWERMKKPGPFGSALLQQKQLPWWRKSNFGF